MYYVNAKGGDSCDDDFLEGRFAKKGAYEIVFLERNRYAERSDLIHEGIATGVAIKPRPRRERERSDLIHEGIATFLSIDFS